MTSGAASGRAGNKGPIMTPDQLERYRQQLEGMRVRLQGDVTSLSGEAFRQNGGEASGNLSNAPLHMADLGTDTFEQEMSLALLETEERRLELIAAALTRIAEGAYGRCSECGRDIAPARLDALPYTPVCVECARTVQRDNAQREAGHVPSPGNL